MRALSLALALCACTAPQEPPMHSGAAPVRVAIGDGVDWTAFRSDQRDAIASYLPTLSRVGVLFELSTLREADVVVRSFDSGAGCTAGAGRYVLGWRYVEIDAACVPGLVGVQHAAGHELLHWITYTRAHWRGHICKRGDESNDCHATVRGRALLNPTLPHSGAFEYTTPDATPTRADAELLRALGIVRER